MSQQEIWKNITGLNNYKVSNLGKIINISKNKPLLIRMNGNYNYAHLKSILSRRYYLRVDKLVASEFIPLDGDMKMAKLSHKNGNNLDDRATNLEWL